VLRLDAAGDELCSYDDAATDKFVAEVAFYNTVATGQSFTFAVGLSPFLPFANLQTSAPLAWTRQSAATARQPGELWVR